MSVDEAFEMYETAVDKLLEKSDGLLLSLVIPCRYERLNQKGSEFNEKVNNKYLKILSVGWFWCYKGPMSFKRLYNKDNLSSEDAWKKH